MGGSPLSTSHTGRPKPTLFVSYGYVNLSVIQEIEKEIGDRAKLIYWDKDFIPGDKDWPQIEAWIDEADAVMIYVTKEMLAKGFCTGQEIGMAFKVSKKVFSIVEPGIPLQELGLIKDMSPFFFDHTVHGYSHIVKALEDKFLPKLILKGQKRLDSVRDTPAEYLTPQKELPQSEKPQEQTAITDDDMKFVGAVALVAIIAVILFYSFRGKGGGGSA